MRDPNPHATLTRHCPEHGEYEQDCDKPETGCPTCAASPAPDAGTLEREVQAWTDEGTSTIQNIDTLYGSTAPDAEREPVRRVLIRVLAASNDETGHAHLVELAKALGVWESDGANYEQIADALLAAAPGAEREPVATTCTCGHRREVHRIFGADCSECGCKDYCARFASPAPSSGGGAA